MVEETMLDKLMTAVVDWIVAIDCQCSRHEIGEAFLDTIAMMDMVLSERGLSMEKLMEHYYGHNT